MTAPASPASGYSQGQGTHGQLRLWARLEEVNGNCHSASGTGAEATMTGDPRFLFVSPCLKKDATSCRTQQSCNKILTIKQTQPGGRCGGAPLRCSDTHSGGRGGGWWWREEASPILGKSSDGVRYCITRRHCFVNVTSSVFDLISRCSGQCENPYQVHDPALCSL